MDNIKSIIGGAILTLVVGGTVYNISQEDVVNNLLMDTGMTQEESIDFIENIPEEDLGDWDEIGHEFITEGENILSRLDDIDCVNYEYPWESPSFSCFDGKNQLKNIGNDFIYLGNSYVRLSSNSAGDSDIKKTINYIDIVSNDYDSYIIRTIFDLSVIKELKNTNSYNKALLKAVLDSN